MHARTDPVVAAPSRPPATPTVLLDTTDVDRARVALSGPYGAHSLTAHGDPARFTAFHRECSDDSVAIDEIRYGTGCSAFAVEPTTHSICVVQVTSGSVSVTSGGRTDELTPGRSAVMDPDAMYRMRWCDGIAVRNVRFDRDELERSIASVLGEGAAGTAWLSRSCPASGRAADLWNSGLRMLESSLLGTERDTAGPLWRAEMYRHLAALLLTTHTTPATAGPATMPRRRSTTTRAVDYLNDHADEPFDACALARSAGTSVRSLQEAFRRELGVSPLQVLIRIRLARARAELRTADPDLLTVAEVASKWGFGNLGRFSRRFREEYGTLPSEILRANRSGCRRAG